MGPPSLLGPERQKLSRGLANDHQGSLPGRRRRRACVAVTSSTSSAAALRAPGSRPPRSRDRLRPHRLDARPRAEPEVPRNHVPFKIGAWLRCVSWPRRHQAPWELALPAFSRCSTRPSALPEGPISPPSALAQIADFGGRPENPRYSVDPPWTWRRCGRELGPGLSGDPGAAFELGHGPGLRSPFSSRPLRFENLEITTGLSNHFLSNLISLFFVALVFKSDPAAEEWLDSAFQRWEEIGFRCCRARRL